MAASTENLRKRMDDQLQASHERCVAACNSISQSAEIVALTRQLIIRSRGQIACLNRLEAVEECPPPLLGPRHR